MANEHGLKSVVEQEGGKTLASDVWSVAIVAEILGNDR